MATGESSVDPASKATLADAVGASDLAKTGSGPGSPARRRKIIVAWLLVFLWAGVIWTLGGDDFSLAETNRTFSPILEWFFGELDSATKWKFYYAIRKSAHFVEYAILALLTFRAALLAAPRNQFATAGWVAVFLVATLATADEARQAFSTARSGSPYDVLIDITGGVVATIGLLLITRRMRTASRSTIDEETPADVAV